jgi:hypothetical protein
MDILYTDRKEGFDTNEVVTKRGLAEQLGISERWIEYRLKEGMPCLRLGRCVRFRPALVVAWLEGGR